MDLSRTYNKIYSSANREEGSEKVILGYAAANKQIILKSNFQTAFHVPYYVYDILLKDTSLIADGATAGPFPEAADKIYENRKGYKNVTKNGDSPYPTGELFCSWLSGNNNGDAKWVDRYYSNTNNSFVDTNSTVTLTSGTEYVYDRVGEVTARDIVKKFGGVNGERIKLNLENWTADDETQVDTSSNPVEVKISTNGPSANVLKLNTQTNRISASVINFDNNYKIEAFVPYNSKYALTEEYTWSFWAKSPDWGKSFATQLVGNFSSGGGIGVFLETPNNYPFFVVPILSYSSDIKNNVGHLLFVNQSYDAYKDKQLNYVNLNPKFISQPEFICINSDHHVITVVTDQNNLSIYKFDNTGEPLKSLRLNDPNNKILLDTAVTGEARTEYPVKVLCGNIKINNILRNDVVIIITNKAEYYIDYNLTTVLDIIQLPLVDQTGTNNYKEWAFAFGIDPFTNQAVLFREYQISIKKIRPSGEVYTEYLGGIRDLKIINGKRWVVASDGNLYSEVALQNGTPIYELYNSFEYTGAATNFEIDPYDRLWVLHGNNTVSVFDYRVKPINGPLFKFESGFNTPHVNKHISFLYNKNRATGENRWNCLIYYGDSGDTQVGPQVYVYSMDGKLYRSVDIYGCFDAVLLLALKQDITQFKFNSKGDFTGYERKRIFDKVEPYNNQSQIAIKYCLTDLTTQTTDFRFNALEKVIFKKIMPISDWGYNSWQHFCLTSKDRVSKFYINGKLIPEMTIDLSNNLRYDLTYKSQPPFFIGVPLGTQYSINEEIKDVSAIFNGCFEDIKIYDYAINERDLKLFITKTIPAEDLHWNLPTPKVQYIEQIQRFFKNKIPGIKSQFFNINLCGTRITDPTTRKIIEEEVKKLVTEIKPAHTDFLNIKWID